MDSINLPEWLSKLKRSSLLTRSLVHCEKGAAQEEIPGASGLEALIYLFG